jgi:hypothetical protein
MSIIWDLLCHKSRILDWVEDDKGEIPFVFFLFVYCEWIQALMQRFIMRNRRK